MSYAEDRLRQLRNGTPGITPSLGITPNPQVIRQNPTYITSNPITSTTSYHPTTTYTAAPSYTAYTHTPVSLGTSPIQGGQRLMSDDYVLKDIHAKVHEHIDQKLKLETEKRELELLIEAEVEKQKMMNSRFEEQKKKLKDEIYSLENKYGDLESKYESKHKMCRELDEKLNDMRNECKKLDQDNKTIQSELKRLAEKTNQQVVELKNKLTSDISQLESEKDKYRREADAKKVENANQIKRLEDDFIKRLNDLSHKVANAQGEKERYSKEVGFLKDKLSSLEKEAEVKLKEIETKIREEEKNKRSSALVSLNQKLKSAVEKREHQEKITSQLQRELEDLEKKATEILGPLDNEVKALKEEIEDCKQGTVVTSNRINEEKRKIQLIEKECGTLEETRNRLRQDLSRVEDQHASNMRELNDRFNNSKRNYENEISRLRRSIEDKERELKRNEDEYNALNREYQRLMSNLQSNLSKTINNTLTDYKGKY